jgi:hypothetical protein
VKAGGKLTVSAADSITGTGTITAEAGARLEGPGLPSFSPDVASPSGNDGKVNPAGLEIVFVKKDLKDRTTTVTLGGKVTGGIGTWAKAKVWDEKQSGAPGNATDWSWTVLNGIIPPWVSGDVSMEIKQTNPSLVYYKGLDSVTADNPLTAPLPNGGKDIYFPTNTDNTVKWRQYSKTITGSEKPGAGTPWETDTEYKGFGILLWEDATTKRAELVVKYPITGASITTDIVIVDWSGIEF